jgi:ferredoxin
MSGPDNSATGDRLVRMIVDSESCIGAGQCEMTASEVFLVSDDDAIAAVIGTGLLPRSLAVRVADQCPGRAISFAELDSDAAGE